MTTPAATTRILLNANTLRGYPDDAVFTDVRLTYALHGDRLLWTKFPSLTKAQILAERKRDQGRSGLRWDGYPQLEPSEPSGDPQQAATSSSGPGL